MGGGPAPGSLAPAKSNGSGQELKWPLAATAPDATVLPGLAVVPQLSGVSGRDTNQLALVTN